MTEYGEKIARLEGRIDVIDARMIPLERGVANFAAHTKRADAFFVRAEATMDAQEKAENLRKEEEAARDKKSEKRQKTARWIIGLIAAPVVTLGGYILAQGYFITVDVIQIVREYHQMHHDQKHGFFEQPEKIPQQDATSPIP